MNICIMMGRPTKDPEIHYTQDGKPIARFTLAVDRRFKREGQPDADFHDCICFGRQAEFVEKYIQKGTKIIVNGALQDNNYPGRDGQMIYRKQIVCDNVEFAESKGAEGSAQGRSDFSQNSGSGAAARKTTGISEYSGFAFSLSITSKPSISGMLRSSRIRSGLFFSRYFR